MNDIKNKHKPMVFSLGNKTVLWVPSVNKYVLAEPFTADIIIKLTSGKKLSQIVQEIVFEGDLTNKEAADFVKQVKVAWKKNIGSLYQESETPAVNQATPGSKVYSKKTYQINNIIFEVEYESADAEWYNHPKFAHLEDSSVNNSHHYFRVDDRNGFLSLWVNGEHAGSWEKSENHFLSGKFSMQIIQKIYGKEEDQWMGVFHAAGISNGKQCVMFFGDSGNGKSTLSALLMSAGFDVLSDDFLPVDSKTGLVYRFPAALSIKKQAYDLVTSFYPELKDASEYENPAFGKTYRFLAPKNIVLTGVPCKAIIHVKYDPQVEFQIEKITPEETFTLLVPDSWINQNVNNVTHFIHWFEQREHFKMVYSNNDKMISTISKILEDYS